MQELPVRGYLYQILSQKHNVVAAVIATTALFTALHGGAFQAGAIPALNVLIMSLLMTVVLEYCKHLKRSHKPK
ncbi:MAG: CPBP family intramembrane metalloprotease [Lachnospiraceae bacterium]|nr:CPBP family intramembrane metalloprotease [Lachnospiraceae bacterium]MBD5512044.1 CPBP family intramembrane metalloprotease [Lachnospiraceae bacterium]